MVYFILIFILNVSCENGQIKQGKGLGKVLDKGQTIKDVQSCHLNWASDEIVQSEHPVRLDTVRAENGVHRVLSKFLISYSFIILKVH